MLVKSNYWSIINSAFWLVELLTKLYVIYWLRAHSGSRNNCQLGLQLRSIDRRVVLGLFSLFQYVNLLPPILDEHHGKVRCIYCKGRASSKCSVSVIYYWFKVKPTSYPSEVKGGLACSPLGRSWKKRSLRGVDLAAFFPRRSCLDFTLEQTYYACAWIQ